MPWPVLPYGFLGTQGNLEDDTYQVSRSLRFNGTSKYLSRTFSASNRKTWTWSGWVKRSSISSANNQTIFGASAASPTDNTNLFNIQFTTADTLSLSGGTSEVLATSQLFRDTSAWYHIVVAFDTTQATLSNRIKMYVNGSQVTSLSVSTYVIQDFQTAINSAVQHNIGSLLPFAGRYFDGYIAEVNFIDGSQLTPSSFGETESTTSRWRPIAYTGAYGTNGFYLPFSRNQAPQELGIDQKTGSFTSATGGLPILNQSQRFLTSGVASDSNASSLVLALPLDTTANLTADQSPTGRTASTKTVTNSSVTATAGVYEYYGTGSALFNGTTSRLSVPNSADFQFGTGDFTVEGWLNSVALKANALFAKCSTDATWITGWSCEIANGYISFYDGNTATRYTGATNPMAINKWYHVAWSRQSGSLKMFVNGNLVRTDAIASNFAPVVNFTIGNDTTTNTYALNAYFQDVRVYKGVAKYTAAFVVPNLNDFIPGGSPTFSVTAGVTNDSLVDSPTIYGTDIARVGGEVRGNYATWNPLTGNAAPSNGNLDTVGSGSGYGGATFQGTFGMASGKWYWEIVFSVCNQATVIGIRDRAFAASDAGVYSYYATNGNKYSSGVSTSYGASWTTSDVIGIAYDADAGSLTFYKNGVSQGAAFTGLSGTMFAFARLDAGNTASANFGQRPFIYAAPSGFNALCTTNLPTPAIQKSNTAMDVVTYTGTGATIVNSSLNFSPDFVWLKSRSATTDHALYDSVRGATLDFSSTSTAFESTQTQGLTSFNASGFTIGTLAKINTLTATYVGWAWDAGSSSSKTYLVTVSGGVFYIDGKQQPTVNLEEGNTYTFDLSAASNSGHPLRFSTTSNGTHGGGTEYTTGVTVTGTAGNAGANIQIVVASGAPTLYYYCSVHSGMGGQLNTNTTAGASNFQGDIASRVQVKPEAGISIVGYKGSGVDQTVGHGLGVAPKLIFVKNRTTAADWPVYHASLPASNMLFLHLPNPAGAISAYAWGGVSSASSTTFTVIVGNTDRRNVNTLNDDYAAYCFAEVEGFSKIGSYTGNLSSNGPFVYCGFRPKWIWLKSTVESSNWLQWDTSRMTFNPMSSYLQPSAVNLETTDATYSLDSLSNGFKIRGTGQFGGFNNNTNTYVFAAFAEAPLKYARAR